MSALKMLVLFCVSPHWVDKTSLSSHKNKLSPRTQLIFMAIFRIFRLHMLHNPFITFQYLGRRLF